MSVFPGDMNIGWGFGLELEHCTGSPTCQCSDCRLTEHNANEAPEDQLPHGYKYESPVTQASREVGLYAMDEPHLTDPLLAVSELEQRVQDLEKERGHISFLSYDSDEQFKIILRLIEQNKALEQRITDLEERLRSLTIVVNELVERLDTHIEENTFDVDEFERIGRELEEKD